MRKVILLLIVIVPLLFGCTKEEPVVPTAPDLHPVVQNYLWGNVSMNSITPCCSIVENGSCIEIYPFNNNEAHITIEKIVISENGFWETFSKEYTQSDNFVSTESYSYFTDSNSVTHGYIASSDDYAYYVYTTLPSAYLEEVMVMLCSTAI